MTAGIPTTDAIDTRVEPVTAPARQTFFLPEVQALRALAVTAVVIYHLWPGTITGGFVGVDMFFAISGFLITGHLLREAYTTGRVDLLRFWGRRIRRLLPASLLVIAVSLVGVLTLTPKLRWEQYLNEITAAAGYFQNWALAASSVDYSAQSDTASPVQHFWSLSVEEQFYLIWPILIVIALFLVRKRIQAVQTTAVIAVLLLISAASFFYAVTFTATNPSEAYFVTGTRVWEFAAGGLLAAAGTASARIAGWVRTVVAFAGWATLLACMFLYTEQTDFPGVAALAPVLGALAVIWAGTTPTDRTRIGASAPVQYIGRISYSVYLWHWPLMIFALTLGELTTTSKVVLLAVTIGLAWFTTEYVEDPARRWAPLANGPRWRTFAAAAVAMAIIIVPAILIADHTAASSANASQTASDIVDTNECYGAGSLVFDCDDMKFGDPIPDPDFAEQDKAAVYTNGCYTDITVADLADCTLVNPDSDVRIALIGDSHAASWYPAVAEIAKDRGWSVTPYLKSSCPMSDAVKADPEPAVQASCTEYNQNLTAELESMTDPFDIVLVAHASTTGHNYGDVATTVAGFRSTWDRLTARGSQVIALRDVPFMHDSTLECVADTGDADGECDVDRDSAFIDDLMVAAAAITPAVPVIDLSDVFCTETTCSPVIGGVTVYRDSNHVTSAFSKTLAPALEAQLLEVVPTLQ
jgi:peptidoglycan/LPS O-acetylase OafA/YrhL